MLRVLIAVFLLGMASVGQSQDNPPPNQESGTPQPASPQNQQPTADNQETKAGSPPVTEKIGRDQSEKSNQERDEKNWAKIFIDHLPDWFVALFTGVLCVFTALLWRSTDRLWKAALDQGRDMKESLQIATTAAVAAELNAKAAVWSQTPIVFVSGMALLDADTETSVVLPEVSFRPRVQFKNFGRTPAMTSAICVDCRICPALPEVPEYRKRAITEVLRPHPTQGPEEEGLFARTKEKSFTLSADELSAVGSGTSFVWVYGFIHFMDFLETKYEVGFCAQLKMDRDPPSFSPAGPPAYTYDRHIPRND